MEKDPAQPHRLTPISEITDKLFLEGFTEEFIMTPQGLKSKSTQEIFKNNDIKIVKHYRYEGTTDPADMSIVYAIKTNNGLRGSIVAGYGPNADSPFAEFMTKVEELPNSNNPNGYLYNGSTNITYK